MRLARGSANQFFFRIDLKLFYTIVQTISKISLRIWFVRETRDETERQILLAEFAMKSPDKSAKFIYTIYVIML